MLRRVAADILAATTVILQGTPSRTDAKGRAERSIDWPGVRRPGILSGFNFA